MKKFKNRKTLLSMLILFIIGLAFGITFIFFITDLDKSILKKEMVEYINLVNSDSYQYLKGFITSVRINLLYMTVIWASGILFIFFPLIHFIIFYKGFLMGFSISTFIFIYKLKGLIYSIIFMFPHEFINIFILITLSVIVLKFSKSLYLKIKSDEKISIKSLSKKYITTYFIFIGFSILSSLLEIFFNTFLIRLVI